MNLITNEIRKVSITLSDGSISPATVPATAYSALSYHGLIDDLFATKADGVAKELFLGGGSIEASFMADENVFCREFVYLFVSGILKNCSITLNDTPLGQTGGSLKELRYEVKEHLILGENILRFDFEKGKESDSSLINELDFGITEPIKLVAFSYSAIDSIKTTQTHNEDGTVTLFVKTRLYTERENLRAIASLTSPSGKMYYVGLRNFEGELLIDKPAYWWPNGYGTPEMYKLTVTLYKDEEIIDSYDIKLGLRKIEAVNDGSIGIKVNGVCVLPMGATYLYEDTDYARLDYQRTERLIKNAREEGVNILRAIPCAAYPRDDFYSLCDKYGIMVMQDFVIEHSGGADFIGEYRYVLKRNSNHPSLCFISINSDDEVFKENANEYLHNTLVLSSDAINSAFGVVSLPDIKTVTTFVEEGEDINLVSPSVEAHCTSLDALVDMLARGLNRYRYANDFDSLIYFSQITQATAIRDLVNKVRIDRKNHIGAIYSSLNEPSPSVSSATIDYFGRKKALHYLSRSFLKPTSLILKTNGTSVDFYISNEARYPYVGTLKLVLEDSRNNTVFEKDVIVSVSVGSSECVHTEDFSEHIKGSLRDYYVSASINDGRVQNASEIAYFVSPKHFNYLDPEFKVEILGSGRNFELVISASAHAALVEVSFSDIDADFENNYFSITKGVSTRISFTTDESFSSETLMRHIVIKSLYNKNSEF